MLDADEHVDVHVGWFMSWSGDPACSAVLPPRMTCAPTQLCSTLATLTYYPSPHRAVRPGVTTDEIDRVVHDAVVERGGYPSPLNYFNFPKSVCTSVNEVICHGIPDRRELQDGDIINVDVTVYYGGFHGDLNETFCVGKVDDKSRRLIKCAHDCLMKAIQIVRPGTRYRDVGDVISQHAKVRMAMGRVGVWVTGFWGRFFVLFVVLDIFPEC